jgi:hypothetical protein
MPPKRKNKVTAPIEGKPPTKTELRKAAEYETHINHVLPRLQITEIPTFVKLVNPVVRVFLTEHAIGCYSKVPNAQPPVLFFAPADESLPKEEIVEICHFVDSANRHNWGNPDGCTAIHIPEAVRYITETPFVLLRNDANGHTPSVLFVSPGESMNGFVGASRTCDMAEFIACFDREEGTVGPPQNRQAVLRDRATRARFVDLHLIAKFLAPPDVAILYRECTDGDKVTGTPPAVREARPPNPLTIAPLDGVIRKMTCRQFVDACTCLGACAFMAVVISDPKIPVALPLETAMKAVIPGSPAANILEKILTDPAEAHTAPPSPSET